MMIEGASAVYNNAAHSFSVPIECIQQEKVEFKSCLTMASNIYRAHIFERLYLDNSSMFYLMITMPR